MIKTDSSLRRSIIQEKNIFLRKNSLIKKVLFLCSILCEESRYFIIKSFNEYELQRVTENKRKLKELQRGMKNTFISKIEIKN